MVFKVGVEKHSKSIENIYYFKGDIMKKKQKKKSKQTIILDHLQSGKSLTTMDAFSIYKETNLSTILHELRKKGHKIIGVDIKPWKLGEPRVPKRFYIDQFLLLEERAKYNLPYATGGSNES